MKHYPDDSLTLHTDLYQINMMQTYWELGRADRNAVFECYFREMPFQHGYAIFAGLERLVHYLEELKFSQSDLDYLREVGGYPEEFLQYLADLNSNVPCVPLKKGIWSLPMNQSCKWKVL